MTTAELLAEHAKRGQTPWIIEGLLRPGLTILSGGAKVGKSRLALSMAATVTQGRPFLGTYASTKVHALYFALEPTRDDVAEAIETFQIPIDVDIDWRLEVPAGTDFAWFEGEIATVKAARPDLQLVVLDMYDSLAKPLMPDVRSSDNSYVQYRSQLRPLQELAKRHNLAVVALMHNSVASGQPIGGSGVSGTADSLWALTREGDRSMGTLKVTGRSVREQSITMSWCPKRGMWLPQGVDLEFAVDLTGVLADEAVGHIVDDIVAQEWVTRPELRERTMIRLAELGRSDGLKYVEKTVDSHTKSRVDDRTFDKKHSRPVSYRRARV